VFVVKAVSSHTDLRQVSGRFTNETIDVRRQRLRSLNRPNDPHTCVRVKWESDFPLLTHT
jgi:hypothetical protein